VQQLAALIQPFLVLAFIDLLLIEDEEIAADTMLWPE
jgi:hypothetical protein